MIYLTQRFIRLLTALSLLFMCATPSLAGVLKGVTWNPITLSVRTSIKDGNTVSIQDPYSIKFRKDGSFSLTNKSTKNRLKGTFTEDISGLFSWDADSQNLENYLIAEITRAYAQKGIALSDLYVNVSSSTDNSKAKYSNNNLQLTVKVKIKFDLGGTADGIPFSSTGSLTISGKGILAQEPPTNLQRTSWGLDMVTWFKANGTEEQESWFLDLYFGPNSKKGLRIGEFLADDSLSPVQGDYRHNVKTGTINFIVDSEEWGNALEEIIDDSLRDEGIVATRINVRLVQKKLIGQLKGINLRIDALYDFTATVTAYGKNVVVKGQFGFYGNGNRL